MCVVSFIGGHYNDKWKPQPWFQPLTQPTWTTTTVISGVSQAEFDELKKEVLEMKELLRKAKIYDQENNEPDCEIEDKMAILRRVADVFGVSLDDVLGPPKV